MIKHIYINISRFVLWILLQVYLFNNIQLSGYINPYPYLLIILLLPFETPGWLLLIMGFLTGLSIDLLSHTLGMHATATVFMAFLRPAVLKLISPRDGYEAGSRPDMSYFSFSWFIRYALILVLAHHILLFFAESFTFRHFFGTLLRIILSTTFTLLIIILSQYIFVRK